jgi:hypothetical protein
MVLLISIPVLKHMVLLSNVPYFFLKCHVRCFGVMFQSANTNINHILYHLFTFSPVEGSTEHQAGFFK